MPQTPPPAVAASPAGLPPRERILNGIKDLPAMPQVITEIQAQMAGADINTRKICGLIEADAAIATKVLRSANSAYYGQSGKVATMTGALNLIGLKGLLEVVALAGAQRLLVGRLPGYGYEAEDLWRHSLAVACGSKLLALRKDPGISETAYLAGLIHDVGRIILDRLVLEMKAEIAEFMEREQKTFLDAETRFFGFNHARVAAEVCRKWKFPAVMAVAIRVAPRALQVERGPARPHPAHGRPPGDHDRHRLRQRRRAESGGGGHDGFPGPEAGRPGRAGLEDCGVREPGLQALKRHGPHLRPLRPIPSPQVHAPAVSRPASEVSSGVRRPDRCVVFACVRCLW
ncbi:MAG: HDOD domain-containing protein [Desulfobacterales bacterium]|nr:HDOD domain-containing protein [Desulfobacterales bacterium]